MVFQQAADFPVVIGEGVPHPAVFRPHLREDPSQGFERERADVLPTKGHRGLQDRRDHHPVPGGEDRPVHRRHGTFLACSLQLLHAVGDQSPDAIGRQVEFLGNRLRVLVHEQHVLPRVVVHLAPISDFEVQREDPSFVCSHGGPKFVRRPGEVIAIVVEADVRVLTRKVSAALAVREDLFRPREDSFGGLAVERVAGELPRVNVVRQEACVVVQHLLEVRHDPPRIRRVSMEASADLIVDAALRHRREGAGEDLPEALFLRPMEEGLRKIFTRTLTAMAQGGVYDQVGGGFHRYSTDPRWIVPHFEKMLYDNAGLLANYVHAWQLTRDPLYRETAEGILSWAEEVLSDRQRGGYFASQDADVGLDDDGDYFTWTSDELKAAVTADEARVLALRFEVGDRGEMHHNPKKNVLFVDQDTEAIAKELHLTADRVRTLITSGMEKLKAAREKRPMPAVDRTIFASWNGMIISAVLDAAMAFGREDVRGFALKSLGRVLSEMWSKDRGMWHALADGDRKVRGLLEDHVYVVDAALAAYAATAEPENLRTAEEIMVFTLNHFWDKAGGFVDIATEP